MSVRGRGIYTTINAAAKKHGKKVLKPGKAGLQPSFPPFSSRTQGRELGRRVLSLVNPALSAVDTLNDWIKEGYSIRKFELNQIVRVLRKLRRYKHALEMHEWMKTQKDFKLSPGDYALQLDLIDKLRGLNGAERFFQDMPDEMKTEPILSSLLHTYVKHKKYDKAEALMEKISNFDRLDSPLPYNHMMTMYLRNGKLEKIPELMKELKKKTAPDIVSYNLWLTMCQSQNDVEAAEKVFLQLKRAKIEPDWLTYSILTNLYIKKELNDCAESTLEEMEKRVSPKDRAAYTSLIRLYANLGNKQKVDRIWNTMKRTFPKLNVREYIWMITSLLKLGEVEKAEKLYGEWESISPTGDSQIPNLLLAYYISKNKLERARSFFHRFEERGVKPSYATWELLMRGNLKAKKTDRALYCLERALGMWKRNSGIVREIYQYLEEEQDIEGAEKLLSLLHNAGHVTTENYNCLLETYTKAGKMPPIIEIRMSKDRVLPDSETKEVVEVTSKMCVTDISSCQKPELELF